MMEKSNLNNKTNLQLIEVKIVLLLIAVHYVNSFNTACLYNTTLTKGLPASVVLY